LYRQKPPCAKHESSILKNIMLSFTDFILIFSVPLLLFFFLVLMLLMLMRPRRFYFIRHGETIMNAEHIRQGEDGILSEKGQRQAKMIGHYLKHFPIKQIISSTYPRAKETAGLIAAGLKIPVVYSILFAERRNPSEIIGKKTDDPEVVRIVDQMDLAYHEDDYRFSDEENFVEEKARARKCLAILANQGSRETVIVTHHHFLKMCVAYLLYREKLHAGDFVKLSFFNMSDNASITVCEYHPWKMFSATRGWEVVSYNDHAE